MFSVHVFRNNNDFESYCMSVISNCHTVQAPAPPPQMRRASYSGGPVPFRGEIQLFLMDEPFISHNNKILPPTVGIKEFRCHPNKKSINQ